MEGEDFLEPAGFEGLPPFFDLVRREDDFDRTLPGVGSVGCAFALAFAVFIVAIAIICCVVVVDGGGNAGLDPFNPLLKRSDLRERRGVGERRKRVKMLDAAAIPAVFVDEKADDLARPLVIGPVFVFAELHEIPFLITTIL